MISTIINSHQIENLTYCGGGQINVTIEPCSKLDSITLQHCSFLYNIFKIPRVKLNVFRCPVIEIGQHLQVNAREVICSSGWSVKQ